MDRICWACGATLPPAVRPTGRRRHYCDATCRQAAARARRRAESAAPPIPPDEELEGLISVMFQPTGDPVDAAIEVVLTLRALTRHCSRLALSGPAQLRYRHAGTADALDALLAAFWPVP